MTTFAFVVHPERPQATELANRAVEWLTSRGHKVEQVLNDPDHPHDIDDENLVVGSPQDLRHALSSSQIDLAVSLGGDGTMLRTVAMAASRGIPVLGVNLGRLGYLTEVEPSGLEGALEHFLAGNYRIEERMTLDVWVEGRERSPLRSAPATPSASARYGAAGGTGRPAAGGTDERATDGRATDERATAEASTGEPFLVLNEAVVQKTLAGHTIRLSAQIAGKPFVTYAADGLLVATPTGSTAYNLSVRGPIVSPQLRAIVVTPISPHMLFDRPLILGPDEWLRLELAPPRPALLVLDGREECELDPGDAVVCRPGRDPARLVTFGARDFHAILRARFHLADR